MAGTFHLPITSISMSVLEELKQNSVKEDVQLEYKEALPTDRERDKFLASVAAFANTSGGDLIYGVRARRDDDQQTTGEIESIVGLQYFNLDQVNQKLHSWIRDCINPAPLVNIACIERGSDVPCLIVRVQRSWASIHMVRTMQNPFTVETVLANIQ